MQLRYIVSYLYNKSVVDYPALVNAAITLCRCDDSALFSKGYTYAEYLAHIANIEKDLLAYDPEAYLINPEVPTPVTEWQVPSATMRDVSVGNLRDTLLTINVITYVASRRDYNDRLAAILKALSQYYTDRDFSKLQSVANKEIAEMIECERAVAKHEIEAIERMLKDTHNISLACKSDIDKLQQLLTKCRYSIIQESRL